MPNGTTFEFAVAAADLERFVQQLPADAIVATVLRPAPAESSPLTCTGLRQLLGDHPEERIVIDEEEPQSYVLRLAPSRVYVRKGSQLFRKLKRMHPGGLHIFDKDAVDRMLVPLDPNDMVGDLPTRKPPYLLEDVTAVRFLGWLRNATAAVGALEQDGSWYILMFRPPAEREGSRFVAVFKDSVLVGELDRLRRQHSTGQ